MVRHLHTMYRITDPDESRAFYEALGFEFRRARDDEEDGGSKAAGVKGLGQDQFDVKLQLAQRAFGCSSEKAAAALAENYVGLEHV
jgi:catechol 2,3-dioxygenase-like lactoylglutathione lyase family enzyme